ncbi:MAG: hypothetical protein E7256_02685 [Lachnospiraceae bacterium]|nr:hypothetical protein [Lachnospiraceae bacterium]
MKYLILRSASIFLIGLEILLFIQLFTGFLQGGFIRNQLAFLLDPILNPIRHLLKHSIFQTSVSDMSPLIAFIIITYVQQLLSLL